MTNVWLMLFAIMLAGGVLKYLFLNVWAAVVIDVVILGAVYFLLRRYPFLDFRKTMIFFTGLTVVSILVDIGLISDLVGNLVILAVLVWAIYRRYGGGGSGRPKLRHKWHK